MTTLTVTSNADSGDGSLRAELAVASSGDTINFGPGIGTIHLASTLTINQSVTIKGGGTATSPNVAIDGGGQVADFTVTGGSVVIDGLTIENGYSVGPYDRFGFYPPTAAGGIYETGYGTLTISNSIIRDNSSVGGRGLNGDDYQPFNSTPGGTGGAAAGGIYVGANSTLNLVGENTFYGNGAIGGVGGLGGSSAPFHALGYFVGPMPGGPGGAGGMASSPQAGSGWGAAGVQGSAGSPGTTGVAIPVQPGWTIYAGASGAGGRGGTAYGDYGGEGVIEFDVPLCFTTGTLVQTVRGEIAIQDLVVGDLVVTASSALRPIQWIGHRVMDSSRDDVTPVRISAHAFGPNKPARDLWLSPGHPVLVGADEDGNGGDLVPIMCLVNGTTIDRVAVSSVTYWHIELDAHDVLLAEGLPAESYIDLGSRAWFAGAPGPLHDPDSTRWRIPGRCRPVATDGPVVEAERRRLDMLFEMRLAAACAWPSLRDPALLVT